MTTMRSASRIASSMPWVTMRTVSVSDSSPQADQLSLEPRPREGIQCAEGLVEQEEPGRDGERSRYCRTLSHPARDLRRALVAVLPEADGRQVALGHLVGPCSPAIGTGCLHGLAHVRQQAESGQERVALEDQSPVGCVDLLCDVAGQAEEARVERHPDEADNADRGRDVDDVSGVVGIPEGSWALPSSVVGSEVLTALIQS